jgi:hypothetical protein
MKSWVVSLEEGLFFNARFFDQFFPEEQVLEAVPVSTAG